MTNNEAQLIAVNRLLRQWINGNRKEVAAQLNASPRKLTLYFGARLARTPGGLLDLDTLATLLDVVNAQP